MTLAERLRAEFHRCWSAQTSGGGDHAYQKAPFVDLEKVIVEACAALPDLERDAARYKHLRGLEAEWSKFFADPVKFDAGAWARLGSRWTGERFDQAVDKSRGAA